jgi:hypothetical protein
MKKKVKELTYTDLGRHIVYKGENGDQTSGKLRHYDFTFGSSTAGIWFGIPDGPIVNIGLESDVEFTD